MRAVLVLIALAGCFDMSGSGAVPQDDGGGLGSGGNGSGSDGGVGNPPGGGAPCDLDDDCKLAAATCCECPSFAVSSTDGTYSQCGDVTCPMMPACPTSLVAACVDHACAATCAPLACQTSCANGYATDAAGCLTCACAGPADNGNGCTQDADCVEIAADCCGCTAGGTDTAVPASQAQAYHDALGCSPDAHCPPTNTCSAGQAPRCVQGSCALVTSTEPASACGRTDLPACPSAQACIVNRDPDATMYGVGVCGSP